MSCRSSLYILEQILFRYISNIAFYPRLGASLVTQLVKNLPAVQETPNLIPGSQRSTGEGIGYPLQYFPCGSVGKESACNAGDLGLIPGLGRSPGEGQGNPLQYSGLENSMDCIVHGVAESWTWLTFTFTHILALPFIFLNSGFWRAEDFNFYEV